MPLDERWAPVLPHLSRLELAVVSLLDVRDGELAMTIRGLATWARAHPANLGCALRELHGRLIDYQPGRGERQPARLRLLPLDDDALRAALTWLESRGERPPRQERESRDSRVPGLVSPGAAPPPVLVGESRDSRVPGLADGDSLLGRSKALDSPPPHAAGARMSLDCLAVVERLTVEITGRLPKESELALFRALVIDEGLTLDQLDRGAREVLGRRKETSRVRSMHYFAPRWRELLREERARAALRAHRPAAAGGPGSGASAPGAGEGGERWRQWAGDVHVRPRRRDEREPPGAGPPGVPPL